ncbi:C6 domain protein, partial [Teladorsagia circumcincta]
PCMSCPQLAVVPLLTGYRNGFITLLTSTNGRCKTIELTCEGSSPDDQLALVISGTVFEQGVGSLETNLTCNDMMTWTTPSGYAVPLVSCGIRIGMYRVYSGNYVLIIDDYHICSYDSVVYHW